VIGKTFKGKTFRGYVSYVLRKPGAEIVDTNIFAETVNEFASELALTQKLRPKVSKVVCHITLSLSLNEHLDNKSWEKLIERYLNEMGFTNNLYLAVKHIDTPNHEHIHIVASRIRLDSSIVSDSWDFTRSQAVIRKLEKEFELVEVKSSWESDRTEQTMRQLEKAKVTGKETVKKQLADKIDDALINSRSLLEFTKLLNQDGISVKVDRDRQGKPKGISFKLDEVSMSGSSIGKGYSLNRILNRLESISNAGVPPNIPDLQFQISQVIKAQVQAEMTIPQFIEQLKQSGVDAHVKFTRAEKIKGISFSIGNDSIQGNELGKEYSWGGLQKYLKVNYDPARDNPIILMMQRDGGKDLSKSVEIPVPKISGENDVPESLLVELALELEKLKSISLADPIVSESVDIKMKTDQPDSIAKAYMVAVICGRLLDELGTNRFGEIGKSSYSIYRDGDNLTVERLKGDRELILQVKGDKVEFDNLKEQDIKQFEEAWQVRQENKERVEITKHNEENLSR